MPLFLDTQKVRYNTPAMNWEYSQDEDFVFDFVRRQLPTHLQPIVEFVQQVHAKDKRIQESQLVHLYRCFLILNQTLSYQDPDVMAAALLHDVIEDTNTTLDQVEHLTNMHVRKLVDECTSPDEVIDNLAFLRKIQNSSRDGQIVKLVDRLDNCRAMQCIKESHKEFVERYAQKTFEFFLPIAKNVSEPLHNLLVVEVEKILGGSHGQD